MRSTFAWAGSGLGSGFGGPELNPNVCLKLSKSGTRGPNHVGSYK